MASVEDTLVVRMEASLRKFERQMEAGRRAAETSATRSERAWKRAGGQIAANANQAGTGLQRMIQIGGSGRFVLQNTANQIGDIAVQMGSGTSASRALGQQLPQLLGGFGALGGTLGILGPLMGTVAALGLPLAAALLNVGEEAESTEDRIKALADSIAALKSAQGLASMSAGELLQDYGALADEARAIFEINRQILSIKAQGALDSAARGIAGDLGVEGVFGFSADEVRDLDGTLAGLKDQLEAMPKFGPEGDDSDAFARWVNDTELLKSRIEQIGGAQDNIRDLAREFGITRDAAQEVLAQFAAIGAAQGPREQAQAMSDLADFIHGASGNLVEATEEGTALYEALLEATTQSLELAKVDYSAPISGAAEAAARLADELGVSLGIARKLAGMGFGSKPAVVLDPREPGYDPIAAEMARIESQGYGGTSPFDRPVKRKRGGGGRGGRAPEGLSEAQRLYESTRSEAEKYAAEVERINELHRKFPEIITTEVRDKALNSLNDAVNGVGDVTNRLERGFEDAFAALVDGAGNARDAVRSLLSDLSRLFIRSAIKGLDLGGLFSSIIPGFATGTAYAPGGLAVVGERGPELVNLPRGSQVIPSGRTQAMMGGGAVEVRVTVDQGGNIVPVIQRVSGQVAAKTVGMGMAIQDRKTPQSIQNYTARKG